MKKLICVGFLVAMGLSCASEPTDAERIIEDGVEVVMNRLEPYRIYGEPSVLRLEEQFRIDFESPETVEKGISEISDIEVDSQGNIYIFDQWSRANFVHKFDSEGDYLVSFARSGQGPGELQTPVSLAIDAQDEIWMVDQIPRKLVVFSSEGGLLREAKFEKGITGITPLSNGHLLVSEYVYNQDEGSMVSSLYISTPDFLVIEELYYRKSQDARTSQRIEGLVRTGVRAITAAGIYIGDTRWDYEIRVFALDGRMQRKIRKEYTPVAVTDTLRKQNLMRYQGDPDTQKKIYFPDFLPPYQFGFVGEDGYLFVMTYERGSRTREILYDIFNPEGAFIGRIGLENYGRPWKFETWLEAACRKGRIYCVQQKENGFYELVVYRMIWE